MRKTRTIKMVALAGVFMVAGCSVCGDGTGVGMTTGMKTGHHGDAGVPERYERQPGDPEWLSRLGGFHGHLGPWVVIGHIIGTDALRRLNTPGYFDIEVVCWIPPEHQRQPWSCILDGLQVGTGATMGKQNIRFAWSPEMTRESPPVVHVLLRPAGDRSAGGIEYRLKANLAQWLAAMKPEEVEAMSRELAIRTSESLFEMRSIVAGK